MHDAALAGVVPAASPPPSPPLASQPRPGARADVAAILAARRLSAEAKMPAAADEARGGLSRTERLSQRRLELGLAFGVNSWVSFLALRPSRYAS